MTIRIDETRVYRAPGKGAAPLHAPARGPRLKDPAGRCWRCVAGQHNHCSSARCSCCGAGKGGGK